MQTFFFYDLETSGVNPRSSRIMQFAGQRTDMDLKPVGDPVNIIIKLTPDVVPEPDAIMVTGITPQQTLQDGVTEAEFLKVFFNEVCVPNTIFTGFNSVRFDDEFMRFMLYRNFYDPYEWQWKNGCSRWDLLDVVRMTRALRPDGIKWPFDGSGKPTNRLELIASLNGLDHEKAHDALSDVYASIAVATLLKQKQPKLFGYLLDMRDKKKVSELVLSGQPFVYSSGKYPSEYEKTTAAIAFAEHPKRQAALVYDLRHDPTPYADKTPEQLVKLWEFKKDSKEARLPIKTMRFNVCPAIAPFGVLDEASQKRLKLNLAEVKANARALKTMKDFRKNLLGALDILDTQQQTTFMSNPTTVDEQLYDGFFSQEDRKLEEKFRAADPDKQTEIAADFEDERLQALAPLYKARNFSDRLTPEERQVWEQHCSVMLMKGGQSSRLARYFKRLGDLAELPNITSEKQYLLEELQIYGQSIMPVDAEA
jgi:exodeoxyribonuclease-1